MAISPVRTISTRPCGRTIRSKAAILSADPVTSNRHIVSVEAVFGLGEAVVGNQAHGVLDEVEWRAG